MIQCPDCEKTFAQKKKLNLHRKLCHEPGRNRPHICSFCSKSFTVPSNLRRHKRSVHLRNHQTCPKAGKNVKCQHCDYTCRDQFQLNIHMRRHTRERPFACDLCCAAFSSRADMARHRGRGCPGRPRNTCPTCGQPFTSIQLLNRHYLWDASCGRLRHLHPASTENRDGDGIASLEIFRLQTDDSESDIVGARQRQPENRDPDDGVTLSAGRRPRGGGLVAASRRRVRCGVCINCSSSSSRAISAGTTTTGAIRRCLHPVNYYKVVRPSDTGATASLSSRRNKDKEEKEELLEVPLHPPPSYPSLQSDWPSPLDSSASRLLGSPSHSPDFSSWLPADCDPEDSWTNVVNEELVELDDGILIKEEVGCLDGSILA